MEGFPRVLLDWLHLTVGRPFTRFLLEPRTLFLCLLFEEAIRKPRVQRRNCVCSLRALDTSEAFSGVHNKTGEDHWGYPGLSRQGNGRIMVSPRTIIMKEPLGPGDALMRGRAEPANSFTLGKISPIPADPVRSGPSDRANQCSLA